MFCIGWGFCISDAYVLMISLGKIWLTPSALAIERISLNYSLVSSSLAYRLNIVSQSFVYVSINLGSGYKSRKYGKISELETYWSLLIMF